MRRWSSLQRIFDYRLRERPVQAAAHALTAASPASPATHVVSLEDLVPPVAGDSQALPRFFVMLGTVCQSLQGGVGDEGH